MGKKWSDILGLPSLTPRDLAYSSQIWLIVPIVVQIEYCFFRCVGS
jgi:hypothetical protein